MFDTGGYTKATEAEGAEARTRWQKIDLDIPKSRDGWAGDYLIGGDVYMHVFRWTPEGGFVSFGTNLCTATVSTIDYGKVVEISQGHIEIASERDSKMATRKYVKVKWGEQRYLIEEDDVPSFCDYVVGRDSLSNTDGIIASFLSHHEDAIKPTAVLPTVPLEYQKHVRRPIEARIISVGKSYIEVDLEDEWYNDLVTPVVINSGSKQGIKRGMKIPILDSDEYSEAVEITRVGRDHARGIIVRYVRKHPGVKTNEWDDGTDIPEQPIVVGWRLTTSVHKLMRQSNARSGEWEAKQPKR